MILGEYFEKFLARSPVSVMVRGILERIFDPEKLERVFTDHALLQYPRELTSTHCPIHQKVKWYTFTLDVSPFSFLCSGIFLLSNLGSVPDMDIRGFKRLSIIKK